MRNNPLSKSDVNRDNVTNSIHLTAYNDHPTTLSDIRKEFPPGLASLSALV